MSAKRLPGTPATAGSEPAPLVRAVRASDEAAWRRLWADYLLFYGAEPPDEATDSTWKRLLSRDDPMFGLVTEVEGIVVGFANCALQGSSWSVRPTCHLEDLFVASDRRGAGAGKALLDELIARARENGWRAVYWHTQRDNVTARRLYDRVATADDVVRYTVPITR
ncbi:GNAT family N-acetyltransferase [uncultured Caulobacter sp.]|uniref:GNAT family N-acetyltransferase n=1 Tax=uncultured Caulobacter sp. TaxID=158749 RepID=UPI00261970C8|nr:GNAT family N-acetyltransferase [uncultured Caulobacter sp.]